MSLQLALFNIAIFQGVLLGVIILRSPIFKRKANKYLAYAMIGLSFALCSLASAITKTYQGSLLIKLIDTFCSGALFPVLILLFIVNQVGHPLRHAPKRWWLFLPHILTVAVCVLDMIVDSSTAQILIDLASGILFLSVLFFIPAVSCYAYTFLKYAKNRWGKRWLTQLWSVFFILMFIWVSAIVLAMFSLVDFDAMLAMIGLGSVFLIHWIMYVGIFKFRLAKDQEEIRVLIKKWKSVAIKPTTPQSATSSVNREKKGLGLTEENQYFKKLEALCVNERIYLDHTLDRAQVAERLGISPGYISQLVNTITGDNFSTYINRYRVEAVKAMITDAEFGNYNLLAIGLESGFSSKTTFHTAFKKMTGMTPNAYRKAHK